MEGNRDLVRLRELWAALEQDVDRHALTFFQELLKVAPAAVQAIRELDVRSGALHLSLSLRAGVVLRALGGAIAAASSLEDLAGGMEALVESVSSSIGSEAVAAVVTASLAVVTSIRSDSPDWESERVEWEDLLQRMSALASPLEDEAVFACECDAQLLGEAGGFDARTLELRRGADGTAMLLLVAPSGAEVRSEAISATLPDVIEDPQDALSLRVMGDGGRPWVLRFDSADTRATVSLRVALEQDVAFSRTEEPREKSLQGKQSNPGNFWAAAVEEIAASCEQEQNGHSHPPSRASPTSQESFGSTPIPPSREPEITIPTVGAAPPQTGHESPPREKLYEMVIALQQSVEKQDLEVARLTNLTKVGKFDHLCSPLAGMASRASLDPFDHTQVGTGERRSKFDPPDGGGRMGMQGLVRTDTASSGTPRRNYFPGGRDIPTTQEDEDYEGSAGPVGSGRESGSGTPGRGSLQESARPRGLAANFLETPLKQVWPALMHRTGGDMQGEGNDDPATEELAFPYTYASYIDQTDVLDDGIPPVPRAIMAQRHFDLLLLVREARNLPKSTQQLRESKAYYCVDVTCGEKTVKTDVRVGTEKIGCSWFQRISFSVFEKQVLQARTALRNGEEGPLVRVTLLDCGRYAGKAVIGVSTLALKDMLHLPEHGIVHICPLSANQSPVIGMNGQQTVVTISFKSLFNGVSADWRPPTVEETLLMCESKIQLRPSRSTKGNDATGGIARTASSLFGGGSRRNSEEDALGEQDEPLLDWEDFDDEDDEEHDQNVEYYWREWLEGVMDSLSVNMAVILLVLVDMTNIAYSLIIPEEDGVPENPLQRWLSVSVISAFMLEMFLRMLAMGRRFWKSWFNVFDLFIVVVSVLVTAGRLILDSFNAISGNQSSALASFGVLRAISRVAVVLRVLRVFIKLRRARKLSGRFAEKLRTTVSQNKRRYIRHGFDLDLTYITNRIMVMATPAFGQHSSFRNDIHVVSRFMSFRHYGCFFIINACDTFTSSDGLAGNYNYNMLFNQVQRIPFEDHGPPLLSEMVQYCEEIQMWLSKDQRNVIAIHCKGGKGRSGVLAACALLWTGHRKTALDALELFTFRRTINYNPELGLDGTYAHYFSKSPCNQTVEGPSQIRWVHYLEAVLYGGIDPIATNRLVLVHLILPVDLHQSKDSWYLSYSVTCNRSPVFDSRSRSGAQLHEWGGVEGDTIELPLDVVVWGDVRICFYRHLKNSASSKATLCFWFLFNPAFYGGRTQLVFPKSKIDIINKDRKNKKTAQDFYICLECSWTPSSHKSLETEERMVEIFRAAGRRRVYQKGDIVIRECCPEQKLIMIQSGSVEGVVYNQVPGHPLGRSASEACSLGGKNEMKDLSRVPNIEIRGAKSIVGVAGYLSQAGYMLYRARTDVEVFELDIPTGLQEDFFPRTPSSLPYSGEEIDNMDLMSSFRSSHTQMSGVFREKSRIFGAPEPVSPVEDIRIVHEVSDAELEMFYRGLSISLGAQLARVREESIRIGSLKAFNDRQTVLADEDESEKLRKGCIKGFGLPMNEKLITRLKCHCRYPGERTSRRVRLLVLDNYLIFDPEFFGPIVGQNSDIVEVRQMHSVAPADESQSTIVLTLLGERVHGLDIAANIIDYELSFKDNTHTRHLYHVLSGLCKKAEEARERDRIRPFDSPAMSVVIENSAKVFRLKKGELLVDATSNPSLFLVRTGEIRLHTKQGTVFRQVREGCCFGEVSFSRNTSAGHYSAIATCESIVLEISHDGLERALGGNHALAARFFFIVCQVIERETALTVEGVFPGTWSQKRVLEETLAPPPAASPVNLSARPTPNPMRRSNSRTHQHSQEMKDSFKEAPSAGGGRGPMHPSREGSIDLKRVRQLASNFSLSALSSRGKPPAP